MPQCPPRAAARVAMLGSPLPVRSHPGGLMPSSATASISSSGWAVTVTSTAVACACRSTLESDSRRTRDACQRSASSTVGPGCLNEAGKEDLDFPLGGLLLLAAASRQRQDNRRIGPRLRKQVLVRAGRGLAAPKRGPDHGVRPHHSRARISNLAVFRAAPRRDSRSLLIICVIGRKRTARVIGDHHGRDVGTATVLLAATDPCRSG